MERARKMILVPEGPTTTAAPVPAVEAPAAAEEKSLQTRNVRCITLKESTR